MNKELVEQYAFKVTQANRSQLVVVMYDIILEEFKEARAFYASGDLDAFVKELKQAQKYVMELMNTLDCQYPIGIDLMALYLYVNKQIITATIRRKPEPLEGLEDVILKLRTAFAEISKTDYSEAVMSDSEQVYAGLTYHKTNLNEAYLDSGSLRRGFTV